MLVGPCANRIRTETVVLWKSHTTGTLELTGSTLNASALWKSARAHAPSWLVRCAFSPRILPSETVSRGVSWRHNRYQRFFAAQYPVSGKCRGSTVRVTHREDFLSAVYISEGAWVPVQHFGVTGSGSYLVNWPGTRLLLPQYFDGAFSLYRNYSVIHQTLCYCGSAWTLGTCAIMTARIVSFRHSRWRPHLLFLGLPFGFSTEHFFFCTVPSD